MSDIIHSNFMLVDPISEAHQKTYANFRLEEGQIVAVYTADDSQNIPGGGTGRFTLFDVMLYLANGATEPAPRCRAMQPLFGGSINNYFESTTVPPGAQSDSYNISKDLKPGARVIVGFLGGQKQNGVILGTLPSGNTLAVANRPKKAQGTVTQLEIQGVNVLINNDGELVVSRSGPKDNSGKSIQSSGPTTVTLDKTGGVSVSTHAGQKISIDAQGDQISAQTKAGATMLLSGKQVAFGTASIELLAQILAMLVELIKEQHISGAPGFVTSPPVNAPQYVKIQELIKQLMKGL